MKTNPLKEKALRKGWTRRALAAKIKMAAETIRHKMESGDAALSRIIDKLEPKVDTLNPMALIVVECRIAGITKADLIEHIGSTSKGSFDTRVKRKDREFIDYCIKVARSGKVKHIKRKGKPKPKQTVMIYRGQTGYKVKRNPITDCIF